MCFTYPGYFLLDSINGDYNHFARLHMYIGRLFISPEIGVTSMLLVCLSAIVGSLWPEKELIGYQ